MHIDAQIRFIIEGMPSKFVRYYGAGFAEGAIGTVNWRAAASYSGDTQAERSTAWRGDHTFSSAAAGFSLKNFIEPEIEISQPHLSKKEIKKLALEKFQERLRQDLSFEHQEASHEDTTVHWVVIDGKNGKKELATSYGSEFITLSQLWEHTKEYAKHTGNTAAYNAQEERAQLSMQDAFINGKASGFISVISHPDAIRYVQVWEKTPMGDIASKQIDLFATTGRDFTHKEGEEFIKRIVQYQQTEGALYAHDDISYAHALFTSHIVSDEDIRTIAVAHALTYESYYDDSTHSNELPVVSMREVISLSETRTFLGASLPSHIEKRIHTLHQVFLQQNESQKAFVAPSSKSIAMDDHQQQQFNRINAETNHLPLAESDPMKEREEIVKHMLAEWVFERAVISYSVAHEQMVFGALHILTSGHSEPLFLQREEKQWDTDDFFRQSKDADLPVYVNKQEQSHQIQEYGVVNHTMHLLIERAFECVHYFLGETKIKIAYEKALPMSEVGEKTRDVSPFHEVFEISRRGDESIEEKIIIIFQSLLYLAAESKDSTVRFSEESLDPLMSQEEAAGTIFSRLHQHEKIISAKATFGIVVWMLLGGIPYKKEQCIDQNRFVVDRDESIEKKRENADVFSASPWVLFAIIWYLSQLRESGVLRAHPVFVQDPKKKQKSASAFPLSGIIYIYIHDRIKLNT